MARLHGVAVEPSQPSHAFAVPEQPFGTDQIRLASVKLDLKTRLVQSPLDRLAYLALPALAMGPDSAMYIMARVGDKKA